MKNDEFNIERITNEADSPYFEFGATQDDESTSFDEPHDGGSDELNDNSTSNDDRPHHQEKPREQQNQQQQMNQGSSGSAGGASSASSASSIGAQVATVAGVSMVAVTTLSTIVGINIFSNAVCNMHRVVPSEHSISYELELSNTEDGDFVIQLENDHYQDRNELLEGPNEGIFEGLLPDTAYTLSVIDLGAETNLYYQVVYTSSKGGEGEGGGEGGGGHDEYTPIAINFVGNGGTGLMRSVEWKANVEYTIPECGYEAPYGFQFDYWTISGGEEPLYPGDKVVLSGDTIFVANWSTLKCKITFVANNGTDETMEPVYIDSGSEYTFPESEFSDPDDHMMFYGWYINGSTRVNAGFTWNITADMVLTACYVECCLMTYVSDNGLDETYVDKVKADDYVYDTLEECPFTAPEGMIFDHWRCRDQDIGPGGWIAFEEDQTIYACWVEDPYTHIRFDANGGSGEMEEILIDSGMPVELPECGFEAPEGYAFGGWLYDGEVYPAGFEYEATTNVVFEANWLQKEFKRFSVVQADEASRKIAVTLDYVGDHSDYDDFILNLDDGVTTYQIVIPNDVDGENKLVFADVYDPNIVLSGDTSKVYYYELYGRQLEQTTAQLAFGSVCFSSLNPGFKQSFYYPQENKAGYFATGSSYLLPIKVSCNKLDEETAKNGLYLGYKRNANSEMSYDAFYGLYNNFTKVELTSISSGLNTVDTFYDVAVYTKDDQGNYMQLTEAQDLNLVIMYSTTLVVCGARMADVYIDDASANYALELVSNINASSNLMDAYLGFNFYGAGGTVEDTVRIMCGFDETTLANGYLTYSFSNVEHLDQFYYLLENVAFSVDLVLNFADDISTQLSVNIYDKNVVLTIMRTNV